MFRVDELQSSSNPGCKEGSLSGYTKKSGKTKTPGKAGENEDNTKVTEESIIMRF